MIISAFRNGEGDVLQCEFGMHGILPYMLDAECQSVCDADTLRILDTYMSPYTDLLIPLLQILGKKFVDLCLQIRESY